MITLLFSSLHILSMINFPLFQTNCRWHTSPIATTAVPPPPTSEFLFSTQACALIYPSRSLLAWYDTFPQGKGIAYFSQASCLDKLPPVNTEQAFSEQAFYEN